MAFDAFTALDFGTPQERDAAAANASQLGPVWPALRIRSARVFGEPTPDIQPWPLDRSTPARLALTAGLRSSIVNDVPLSVADELHVLAEQETSGAGKTAYLVAEMMIREPAGQLAEERTVMLGLTQMRPREAEAWVRADNASYGLPGFRPLVIAYSYWVPEQPDSWNAIGYTSRGQPELRERFAARAAALAPDTPLFASNYVVGGLLFSGKPAAARAVTARLWHGGARQRRAGRMLEMAVDAASLAFKSALERGRALIADIPEIGTTEPGLAYYVLAFDIERLVTGATELADAAAERFVLADPPRLSTGHVGAAEALALCGWTRAAIAARCVARVLALVDAGYFREGSIPATKPLLEGLEKSVAGDMKGAAAAFRGMLDASYPFLNPRILEAFERTGDYATLDALDLRHESKIYGGVSAQTVHAARMAAKRGDKAKAKALAQRVVDAWATADTQMVALDEMRAILK